MIENLFQNYQWHKLAIGNPELNNAIIWTFIFLISIITLKKEETTETILNRHQTIQLRGFAAILVVVSHFWMHVAIKKPNLMSRGETVFLFLFFSGFGLMMSQKNRNYGIKKFILHRIDKVMIPYWGITIILVLLDIFLINKSYNFSDIAMTSFGINVTTKLNHIDYARWYITFLLTWYIFFYFAYSKLKGIWRHLFLFSAAIFLFLTYRRYTFAHQFTAFPIGALNR